MAEKEKSRIDKLPAEDKPRKSLPQGYRQGIITAITVLLGFSLGFFKFWGFEAPGHWTYRSTIPAVTLIVTVALQIIALYRALRPQDDEENEYHKTVLWFISSAVVLLCGLVLAVWEFA